MNSYIKIVATTAVACIVISAVKEIKREYAVFIALICGVLTILSGIDELKFLKSTFDELISLSDVSSSALKIFFKAVGISIISSLTSDACIDGGNKFLASCVEFSGKIAIMVSALPLINSVIKIIAGYIGT